MHIRCMASIWLTQVALGSHSRKLNKYMEIKAPFPLFQQNIITRPVANNSYMCRQERRMKRYISTSEITLKKFIVENWSFDFLSVLNSFKLKLYSIQIKIA